MGKETIYRCDYKRCSATRPFTSPTNHWFIIGKPTDSGDLIDGKGIVIMPFPSQQPIDPLPADDLMFCGEQHALAYLTQQMWGFYNHLVEAPPVVESVAPATTGVGNSSTEAINLEQVPFSDLPAVERDEFCMDVEDPTEPHITFCEHGNPPAECNRCFASMFPPRKDLS